MLSFGIQSRAIRYHNFWFIIIRFKRFLQIRSENSEKLGKGFFLLRSLIRSAKKHLYRFENSSKFPFSSHLFFRQSWTKVLRHFCISRAFSNSHRPNPSPHPTNNVGRVYPEFFLSFNFRLQLGVTVHQSMLISICKCLCNIMEYHGFVVGFSIYNIVSKVLWLRGSWFHRFRGVNGFMVS